MHEVQDSGLSRLVGGLQPDTPQSGAKKRCHLPRCDFWALTRNLGVGFLQAAEDVTIQTGFAWLVALHETVGLGS